MLKKRNVTLAVFLKGSSDPHDLMPGCANYDHHYGGCLFENFGGKCAVLDLHKRCGWFERAVLPTSADIGQAMEIRHLYEVQVGQTVVPSDVHVQDTRRPCPDCGQPLRPCQRVCDSCAGKRRRTAAREYRYRRTHAPQLRS